MSQWDRLVDATEQKGSRLKEATEGQSFNRNLEDIDLWLSECEAQLANEDLGKLTVLILIQLFYTHSFHLINRYIYIQLFN